ncbi:MAG: DNA mismatch repair endonuclease MutL [Vicinamibacterales bacterium]
MSKIQRLTPSLANQIAAGEVVERPASVVKELVENAIDAGARRIDVTIDMGGKRLIRVEDDGEGMDAEDARLALERHATSKLRRPEDLEAITTLGFRGEALPSIASVSHFTLRTRTAASPAGVEVRVDGGAMSGTRDIGAPIGTAIEVADLFYNLPARRKFLKSDAAEAAQVSRLMTQLALVYPEVGFSLVSAGRRVLQAPPARSIADRFFQIFGERDDLVTVSKSAGGITVTGFAAALADQGPVRGAQNVFVNRRIVKDRTIAHAIVAAYAGATIKEKSPEVHLFIELPPDRVDVNVHPTKAEVRFLESSLVHEVLRRAIGEALGTPAVPELRLEPSSLAPSLDAPRLPGVFAGAVFPQRWRDEGGAATDAWRPAASGAREEEVPSAWQRPGAAASLVGGVRADEGPLATASAAAVDALRPMVPLGQFRDTYIIAVDAEGISIVDQHVAHERILFEQVLERLTTGAVESQRLLVPVVLELSPGQLGALANHRTELARLGFEVDEFGGRSVRAHAVPAVLTRDGAEAGIRALADDLEGLDRRASVDAAMRQIAATTACHAAVKANYPLTFEKMQFILDELRRTAYSTVCPHGRPVMLRLSRREVEKNFQRI